MRKRVRSVRNQPTPSIASVPTPKATARTCGSLKMPRLISQITRPSTHNPPPIISIHWMLRGSSRASNIRCHVKFLGAAAAAAAGFRRSRRVQKIFNVAPREMLACAAAGCSGVAWPGEARFVGWSLCDFNGFTTKRTLGTPPRGFGRCFEKASAKAASHDN